MRLIELEIFGIRGIVHQILNLSGKNFVIYGTNGSGKSAIVDAIDFLLTGKISRLLGQGTSGISLSRHGPHVDCQPADAYVRAVVQFPTLSNPVEIKRCIAAPNTLECDDSIREQIEPILKLAEKGQHILTRREILKYITAEGNSRAQDIQNLLNISEVEILRKNLVTVLNSFKGEFEITEKNLASSKVAIGTTIQKIDHDEKELLDFINSQRKLLSGSNISSINPQGLKKGLKPPANSNIESNINFELIQKDIESISDLIKEDETNLLCKKEDEIKSIVTKINDDLSLLRSLNLQELTQLGVSLIDQSGSCPLCETNFPEGKLKLLLEKRLEEAITAQEYKEKLSVLCKPFQERLALLSASLDPLITATDKLDLKEELQILEEWKQNIQLLSDTFTTPIDRYLQLNFDSARICKYLSPDNITVVLGNVLEKAKQIAPELDPLQTAWDTLTRLEVQIQNYDECFKKLENAKKALRRAKALALNYQQSRDQILNALYEDVSARFIDLYKKVHNADEGNFNAALKPDNAALKFEVDFYGRGLHPPHALHSEGHQDSMGVCLFLALAEKLTKDKIDLVILDDVVMSVDIHHRRFLADLLHASFPHRQFLITTHDTTWANQLRYGGVVDKSHMIEFYSWCVDTGPQVNYEVDIWNEIQKDIDDNDVPGAAQKLRRSSEQFYGIICNDLQATVIYRMQQNWTLGDYLPNAVAKFRKIINMAKASASSWGNQEKSEELTIISSTVDQVYARTQAEQWAINPTVHFNEWTNFVKEDFIPVVEAFKDLQQLFICGKCGETLKLTFSGMDEESLKCACGEINWNLKRK